MRFFPRAPFGRLVESRSGSRRDGAGTFPSSYRVRAAVWAVAAALVSWGWLAGAPAEAAGPAKTVQEAIAELPPVKVPPIIQAIHKRDTRAVVRLLDAGADVNVRDPSHGAPGYTPLHWAAKYDDEALARLLVARGADVNAPESLYGWPPLVLALRNETLARYLIDSGAKIQWSQYGIALHSAVSSGSVAFVSYLLAKGADIDAPSQIGMSPLQLALRAGRSDNARFLIERGAKLDRKWDLWYATRYAVEDVAMLLIDRGADIRAKDDFGWTALHWAAQHGQLRVVKRLLDLGVDVDGFSAQGVDTPLSTAAYSGRTEVVRELLARGAQVNHVGQFAHRPLNGPAITGHLEIVRLLLEKGADVNAPGNGQRTPLIDAAGSNHPAIVALLLEYGADPGPRDDQGKTAMDYAVIRRYGAVIDVLRAHAAKP